MRETELAIDRPQGRMPVFLTRPEEGGPFPTVIFYMDALGIREELRDMARRLATVGYCVALPNLFYRDGGPAFDAGRLPVDGPDPEMMRLNLALSHAQVIDDTRELLAALAHEPDARLPVATLGYCMGRRHAFAAAGSFADSIVAMASLHGGYQVTDRPDSPHLLIERIRGECYFGFAEGDPVSPPEHQHAIAAGMLRHGVVHRLEVYPGVEHGFTFPERYCYHKPSAERAWERIFALLRRTLLG